MEELTDRLNAIGVHMSTGGVANEEIRSDISPAFLFQCMDAFVVVLEPAAQQYCEGPPHRGEDGPSALMPV